MKPHIQTPYLHTRIGFVMFTDRTGTNTFTFIYSGFCGAERSFIIRSIQKMKLLFFDPTPTYSQYANSEIPIVIKTMLKITERNANRTTPHASTIIARTRIHRSGVGLLEALFDSIFGSSIDSIFPIIVFLVMLFLPSLASTLLPLKFSRPPQCSLSYP